MLLRAVNESTRRIVKLPTTESADRARMTKSKVNAIHANARFVQRVTNESLYRQIWWNSVHIRVNMAHSRRESRVFQNR